MITDNCSFESSLRLLRISEDVNFYFGIRILGISLGSILSVVFDVFIDSDSFFVILIVIVIDSGEICYDFFIIKEEFIITEVVVVYKSYRNNCGFEFI